jgi:hypothetical protein
LGTGREIETLRATIHDKDEALQAAEKVRRMMALDRLVREKVRGVLLHGVKGAMAVVRSGFEYDMGLVADWFHLRPEQD